MWERDRYHHHGGKATAGRMLQTHTRSAGKNTCREVKFRHQVYSYVRYSNVLDSDVNVDELIDTSRDLALYSLPPNDSFLPAI